MAVAKPLGAWVDASVARVRRSIKRGEVVNHPRRDPGQEVLEKVCCQLVKQNTHIHTDDSALVVYGEVSWRKSLQKCFLTLPAFFFLRIDLTLSNNGSGRFVRSWRPFTSVQAIIGLILANNDIYVSEDWAEILPYFTQISYICFFLSPIMVAPVGFCPVGIV